MATGISVNSECTNAWNEMKIKHRYDYITFKIENDQEIVVDQKGPKGSQYDDFLRSLPVNDCRYAVVEIPGTTKIIFIMWTPDTAPVKSRMIYASTRQAITDKLSGHHRTIQAGDLGDIGEQKILQLRR